MVETRSLKKKKPVEMAAEFQHESSHHDKDSANEFIERMLEKIEKMEGSLRE